MGVLRPPRVALYLQVPQQDAGFRPCTSPRPGCKATALRQLWPQAIGRDWFRFQPAGLTRTSERAVDAIESRTGAQQRRN